MVRKYERKNMKPAKAAKPKKPKAIGVGKRRKGSKSINNDELWE